jgi:hypothetical protein
VLAKEPDFQAQRGRYFLRFGVVELCIYFHNVNFLERAFNLKILTDRFFLLHFLSVNISFSSFRGFDLFIVGYLGK